jgi:hypothetical protein
MLPVIRSLCTCATYGSVFSNRPNKFSEVLEFQHWLASPSKFDFENSNYGKVIYISGKNVHVTLAKLSWNESKSLTLGLQPPLLYYRFKKWKDFNCCFVQMRANEVIFTNAEAALVDFLPSKFPHQPTYIFQCSLEVSKQMGCSILFSRFNYSVTHIKTESLALKTCISFYGTLIQTTCIAF